MYAVADYAWIVGSWGGRPARGDFRSDLLWLYRWSLATLFKIVLEATALVTAHQNIAAEFIEVNVAQRQGAGQAIKSSPPALIISFSRRWATAWAPSRASEIYLSVGVGGYGPHRGYFGFSSPRAFFLIRYSTKAKGSPLQRTATRRRSNSLHI